MEYILQSSIIRIHSGRNRVVGAGFLAAPGQILTCCHVVNTALGLDSTNRQKPDDTIQIDFPFLSKDRYIAAHTVEWHPKTGSEVSDIAVLELEELPPPGAQIAELITIGVHDGTPLLALGFPRGFEHDGRYASGIVRGRLVTGRLQIDATSDLGYFIQEGFSGAPVWCSELNGIIGMVATLDIPGSVRTASIISADVLLHSGIGVTNPGHVFVSYAHADGRESALQLSELLSGNKIEVWIDSDLEAGDDYYDQVHKALRSATALLLVVTPGAMLSKQVQAEWNYALQNYLPIIPILIQECQLHYIIAALQYIDGRSLSIDEIWSELSMRLRRLYQDHLESLTSQLENYRGLAEQSSSTGNFKHKLEDIEYAIDDWITRYRSRKVRIAKRRERIASELQQEQLRNIREAIGRTTGPKRKVVGQHLIDTTTYFVNREQECDALRSLISDANKSIISILGRGGIGKTAIVSEVLRKIEHSRLPILSDGREIEGIVYLSTRTRGISLERIFLDIAELLGGNSEKALLQTWAIPELEIGQRIYKLFVEIGERAIVLVLDNFDDLLDSSGEILDLDVRQLLLYSLTVPHFVKIVITSREPIKFPASTSQFDQQILVADGLDVTSGISMLRNLDGSGASGLRDIPASKLAKVVELVRGVPRALEIINSILVNDPFLSIDELLDKERIFQRAEFVQALVEENYKRLDEQARRILKALAVFGRPVPIVAVDYLLESFDTSIESRSILNRLIKTRVVTIDRATKTLSLHPIDRDYIYNYSQIPAIYSQV